MHLALARAKALSARDGDAAAAATAIESAAALAHESGMLAVEVQALQLARVCKVDGGQDAAPRLAAALRRMKGTPGPALGGR